ncbi:protein CFAP210-like isoform X1 [Tachysurus ichikawai]
MATAPESIRKVILPEVNNKPGSPVDLHKVTVLPASEWERIQGSVHGMNKQQEHIMAAARQREALHLRSKEAVKNWPNTIAGQWQKKLELRKIKKEIEEKEKKQIDLDEAKFQEQKRKEAIERAKKLQFFQTDRVKGFHSTLLMTEVLKERDAQIELKKRKEIEAKELENKRLAINAHNAELALQQENQKAVERKQNFLAVAETWTQQIKVHEQGREEELMEKKKEAEELNRFQELYNKEQNKRKQKNKEEKGNIMKAYQEQFAEKKILLESESEKQELEEEKRKLVVKAKNKLVKLWKEKKAEVFRETQRNRQVVADKLAAYLEQPGINEEELISRAAAEAVAKQDKRQHEKEEQQAVMLRSIAEHREAMEKQLKCKKQEEKQMAAEMLEAKKASDLLFHQEQKIKAQKKRETAKMLQDSYVCHLTEKHAQNKLKKKQQQESKARHAELIAEEENQFQVYATDVIQRSKEAQRNTSLLQKASRAGFGGGRGPLFEGVRPSYLVQDYTGVQLPSYAHGRP